MKKNRPKLNRILLASLSLYIISSALVASITISAVLMNPWYLPTHSSLIPLIVSLISHSQGKINIVKTELTFLHKTSSCSPFSIIVNNLTQIHHHCVIFSSLSTPAIQLPNPVAFPIRRLQIPSFPSPRLELKSLSRLWLSLAPLL